MSNNMEQLIETELKKGEVDFELCEVDVDEGNYCFNHNKLPLLIELILGDTLHIQANLMAPLEGVDTPEDMIQEIKLLIKQRDFLRERGYQQGETFSNTVDGTEIIYKVPYGTIGDLIRVLKDFNGLPRT